MRHTFLICAFFLLFQDAFSAPVDAVKAQLVGKNFLKTRPGFSAVAPSPELVQTKTAALSDGSETPIWHLFKNGAGKGFILVSGDDRVQPVLGYSTEGSLFPTQDLPENLSKWLDHYRLQIISAIENHAHATAGTSSLWAKLLAGTASAGVESGGPAARPDALGPVAGL